MAIIGLMMERGVVFSRHARAGVLARALPDWPAWQGGDLGYLSQQQAGDLLEYLEEKRRTTA
jgi:hypothetical protein